MADNGYKDEKALYPSKSGNTQVTQCRLILARHETENACFKTFNELKHTFRHGLHLHGDVFHAISNIVQASIENRSPMFQV